jgi:hypothetical protein
MPRTTLFTLPTLISMLLVTEVIRLFIVVVLTLVQVAPRSVDL